MPKTSKPTLTQAIVGPIEKRLRNTAVALPGIVRAFHGTTVDVQPGVHRAVPSSEDPDLDVLEVMPVITSVPIVWLQAVGIRVRATLRVGDPVLLLAMDRDISLWRKSGQPDSPGDSRMHHWGSCVAIPGLIPNSDPYPEPADAAALASVVIQDLNELRDKLEDLTNKFIAHTHATAGTGIPSPPGPLPAGTPYAGPPGALPTSPPALPDSMLDPSSVILKLGG